MQDPVRKEVPDAVAVCKRAGIFVRMVTGDNVHTASHIARDCGIMMEGGLALEGPTFRKMTEEELIPILPRLQVNHLIWQPVVLPVATAIIGSHAMVCTRVAYTGHASTPRNLFSEQWADPTEPSFCTM